MHSHQMEELAMEITEATGADPAIVREVLENYWSDKIAITWAEVDLAGTALKQGRIVSSKTAMEILHDVQHHHDAELGVTWLTLEIALESGDKTAWFLDVAPITNAMELYHPLTAETAQCYESVYGNYRAWRWVEDSEPVSETFGEPEQIETGNLVKALLYAMEIGTAHPNEAVFIGLVREEGAGESAGAADLLVYKLPEEDSPMVLYASEMFTGQEHRRTISEVQRLAEENGNPVSEEEAERILDELEGEYEFAFDVSDADILRALQVSPDIQPGEEMDGDAQSALASAGWGMDEDYFCGTGEE